VRSHTSNVADGERTMTTTIPTGTLYVALELGQDNWLIAWATQAAQKPRYRGLPARDLGTPQEELAKAQQRCGRPAGAPVGTGSEAGRQGVGLHRAWTTRGIHKVIVDSGALEVNRRRQHVQSDPVDAAQLVNLLCRYHGGERPVFRAVNVPTVVGEDRRQLHRGLRDLQRQQTECSNGIQGLLAPQGLEVKVGADSRTALGALRDRADQPVPAGLRERVLQEFAVGPALHRPVRDAAHAQERPLREGKEPYLEQVRRLRGLKAVGVRSARILVTELFAGRDLGNGQEL